MLTANELRNICILHQQELDKKLKVKVEAILQKDPDIPEPRAIEIVLAKDPFLAGQLYAIGLLGLDIFMETENKIEKSRTRT
jgi:hypothetical protein